MPTIQHKIFSCPNCSLRVSGLEKACPRCGTVFEKDTKLECPFCGTLVPPTAASCPSCQIVYSELHSKAEERLWDKAVDKIIEELDDIAEADAADLVCQKCNSVLERPKARCSKCGFSASHTERKPERLAEKREPPPPEPDAEETEAVCPICDSVVGLRDSVCPHCGAEFLIDDEGVEEEEIEEAEPIYCPACYKEVDLEITVCPHCGAEFEEGEDLGPPLPADEIRFESVPESHALSETDIARAKDEGAEITTSTPVKRSKGPRGLSNGTSAVNGVGIINGKSRINGVHLTNGLGETNGRDMINGTGLARGEAAGRIRVPLGVRGLAVLMVIVIVISAFVYVSYSHKGSPYEVDGNFDEWEDEVMFTMIAASTSPATDVVEWAAATYNTQLHVYVKVEGQLMAGDSAQRLMFFVDADDKESTGYLVGEIGADFMLEILGWNETVMASIAYEFGSTGDQLNWSLWRQIGSVLSGLSDDRIEAMAHLPTQLNSSSRIILVSQDSEGIRCTSYPILLGGGLLIIDQIPAPEIAATDIIASNSQTELLQLRFSCQGEGGNVDSVIPEMIGFDTCEPIAPFSLEPLQEHTDAVVVDSSQALPGQFVSAELKPSSISSSFQRVLITGNGAQAYCISPPETVSIDGAFADWTNKTMKDIDDLPVTNPNVDIDDFGADSSADNSYFYMSVFGEMCSGVYVPKDCAVFTSAGGGAVVPARKTAEDFARIFIDSDQSDVTGSPMTIGTLVIGADFMIEIGGVCGEIRSKSVYSYSSGLWGELDAPVQAAKDSSRVEIGVITSSIGNPASMDFIIETTDWRGRHDFATNGTVAGMKGWVIETDAEADSTSMSYQRKLFYDGTNFWSTYYDGTTTVYRYSSDGGENWNLGGDVFSNSGVLDASLWYDSGSKLVYAVGDKGTPSQNVYIQKGSVNPSAHTITWAGSDSTLSVSSVSVSGKNAFICRDTNGYLWILSSRQTGSDPDKFDLVAYISDSVDSISSGWTEDTTMLSPDSSNEDLKGSILPAGTGSDVWVVYNRDSYVDARKRTSGSWGSVENVYTDTGSLEFIITAPASTVIDGNGVVHVVYGDATKDGGTEKPHIQYRYRTASGWQSAITLDVDDDTVGHRYPTISLDNSTGNLYAFWLQNDDNNIQCKKNVSGSWSFVTLSGQTAYDKQYLTSIYEVSGETYICWQWTQNTTGSIEVIFDVIPEFEEVLVPILIMIAVFLVGTRKRRRLQIIEE